MCVVSMVYDHYKPQIEPYIGKQYEYTPLLPALPDFADLRKILEDFTKAKEAAGVVDKLTDQPDCVDPEKQKLDDRVKELEALLAAAEQERDELRDVVIKQAIASVKPVKKNRRSAYAPGKLPSK